MREPSTIEICLGFYLSIILFVSLFIFLVCFPESLFDLPRYIASNLLSLLAFIARAISEFILLCCAIALPLIISFWSLWKFILRGNSMEDAMRTVFEAGNFCMIRVADSPGFTKHLILNKRELPENRKRFGRHFEYYVIGPFNVFWTLLNEENILNDSCNNDPLVDIIPEPNSLIVDRKFLPNGTYKMMPMQPGDWKWVGF